MQAQTMAGILQSGVMSNPTQFSYIFYSPFTKQYYRPPVFKLDEGRLPITCFPKSIKFDGGLFCGPIRNKSDPVPEPFPPGTPVSITHQNEQVKGTISNVPLPFLSLNDTATVERRLC
jgi:hypothetical protein